MSAEKRLRSVLGLLKDKLLITLAEVVKAIYQSKAFLHLGKHATA